MINVIAIDDEPLALLQLKRMIEMTPYFHLVASCNSAFEAMQVMADHPVDAIFADINMPDLSGIDFVRSLTTSPIIVFTTAYSQFALEGYQVNALDYLLKPFGQSEFQRAAAKVRHQYQLLHPSNPQPSQSHPTDADHTIEDNILFVKTDTRIIRIDIINILYIESQSEYLKFHLIGTDPLMVLMSITKLSSLLPADRFIRIHRSYIVNMSHVIEINRQRIQIDPKTFLPIGDSYKDTTYQYIRNHLIGK